MTDIEILKSIGIDKWLDNIRGEAVSRMLLRAMAQARADERVQVGREIYASCENLSDYTVVFGGTNDLRDVSGDKNG